MAFPFSTVTTRWFSISTNMFLLCSILQFVLVFNSSEKQYHIYYFFVCIYLFKHRLIHVVSMAKIIFSLTAEQYSTCIYQLMFISSSVVNLCPYLVLLILKMPLSTLGCVVPFFFLHHTAHGTSLTKNQTHAHSAVAAPSLNHQTTLESYRLLFEVVS